MTRNSKRVPAVKQGCEQNHDVGGDLVLFLWSGTVFKDRRIVLHASRLSTLGGQGLGLGVVARQAYHIQKGAIRKKACSGPLHIRKTLE